MIMNGIVFLHIDGRKGNYRTEILFSFKISTLPGDRCLRHFVVTALWVNKSCQDAGICHISCFRNLSGMELVDVHRRHFETLYHLEFM